MRVLTAVDALDCANAQAAAMLPVSALAIVRNFMLVILTMFSWVDSTRLTEARRLSLPR
jgi:hypothetical protein